MEAARLSLACWLDIFAMQQLLAVNLGQGSVCVTFQCFAVCIL